MMIICLKNINGIIELMLQKKTEMDEASVFALSIRHNPFSVDMFVSIYESVLYGFVLGVKEMHSLHRNRLVLSSINSELTVLFTMDEAGRIVADVEVFAGSNGLLKFSFDFDQSFLPEIITDDNFSGEL